MKILSILNNAYLIILCYLYYLIRGKANKRPDNIKKVLIIQNAKLGDMVCTTPMFRAIKNKYNDVFLYVVGNNINKELLKGNKDIDEYIVFNKNFWELLFYIRNKNIDYAILSTPDSISLALLFLSGVKNISCPKIVNGWSPWETKSYRAIQRLTNVYEHKMGSYAPLEYLKLLKPLDIVSTDTKKYLYYSANAMDNIKSIMKSNNIQDNDFIIGISVSSGNKIKNWGGENFAGLINKISNSGNYKFVLFGTKIDEIESNEMLKLLDKNVSIINTVNTLSLDELKAFISSLNLFISVDTGPIYIAEAFNIPTVDIVGPMDEREQPPVGELHKVIIPMNRISPAIHIMNARDYDFDEARRQIESITIDQVFSVTMDLIKKIKNL